MSPTPPIRTCAAGTWFAAPGAIRLRQFGEEREPVVVVDGAGGDPDALVAIAAERSGFTAAATTASGYPGLLGPAPVAYRDAMVHFALPLIAAHSATGPLMPGRARGNVSLVTTPPDALAADQRVPHVDTTDPLRFAAVHFLSRGDRDGTGFFRHRGTGFATIDASRLPAYRAALDRDMAARPFAGYRREADALFTKTSRLAVMHGQGPVATGSDSPGSALPDARAVVERIGRVTAAAVQHMPAHQDVIRRWCDAGTA